MKNNLIAVSVFFTLITHFLTLETCPTCVAKVTPQSIPFFSTDFYQPGARAQSQSTADYGKQEFKKLMAGAKEKK